MNANIRTLLPILALGLAACTETGTVATTPDEIVSNPELTVEESEVTPGSRMGESLADFVRAKRAELHVQTGLAFQDGVFDAFHLDWVEPPTVDRVRRMADVDVEFDEGGEAAMAFTGAASLGDDVPNSRRCIDEDSYLCWSSIICWECDDRGWTRQRRFCRDRDLDGYPNTDEYIQIDTHGYYCGFLHLNWGSPRNGCLFDDYAVVSEDLLFYESVPEWGTCNLPHDCNDIPGTGVAYNAGVGETHYDGHDQDCSGDEVCFVDYDRDRHGSADGTPAGYSAYVDMPPGADGYCLPGSGYLRLGDPIDDCDDSNPQIYSGQPEICDGYDNDCDGDVDEGLGNWAGCDAPSDNAACMNGYRLCSLGGGSTACSRGSLGAYTFDSGVGDIVPDGGHQRADLTLINGAQYSAAESVNNTSVYFDGVNDAAVNTTPGWWSNSPQVTYSIWVHPLRDATTAQYEYYFAIADDGASNWYVLLRRQPDNKVRFYIDTTAGVQWIESDAAIPVGSWTHIAVTVNATGSMYMYINAVQQASTTIIGVPSTAGAQYVGSLANGTFIPYPFQGYIDEFLILPVNLPQEIIDEFYATGRIPARHTVREFCDGLDNDCMNGPDDPFGALDGDLVDDPNDYDTCADGVFRCSEDMLTGSVREIGPRLFYDMDTVNPPDGSTEVKNVAGRYDGVDGHGDRIGGTYVTGQYGDGYQTQNFGTYIEVPHSNATNITGREMTLTAWVNPFILPAPGTIIAKEDSYAMQITPTRQPACAFMTDTTWAWVYGDPLPLDSNFHHVACRIRDIQNDTAIVEVVVDGAQSGGTRIQNGPIRSSNWPLRIGRRELFGGEALNGVIDEVGVYSTALTDAEIQAVMADGADAVLMPGADPGDNLELCDGEDNNCNGDVDEIFVVGQTGPDGSIEYRAVGDNCDGADSDFCDDEGGVVVCTENRWSAVCTDDPNEDDVEICDNLDNDCDGDVDDGFSLGDACADGDSDACVDGEFVCGGGAAICSGGAMAIYNFEALVDPTVDYSGNGNAAAIVDATVTVTNVRNGYRALQLAGNATSTLRIPATVASRTDEFTVAAWVRPNTGGLQGAIFSVADSAGDNALLLGTQDWLFVGGASYSLPQGLPDNQWTHVAMTYGRGVFRVLYNGGVVVEEQVTTSPVPTFASDIWVGQELDFGPVRPGCPSGCATSPGQAYAGLVDDIVWYGHALEPGEVANLAIETPLTDQNLEQCDFRDNDCDGSIDDAYVTGDPCDGPDADECDTDAITMCEAGGQGTACGWGAVTLLDFDEYALPFRFRDLSGNGNWGYEGAGVQTQDFGSDPAVLFDGSLSSRVSIDIDEAWRDTFTIAFWAKTLDSDAPDQTMVARFTKRVESMIDLGIACPSGRAFEINRSGYIYWNCARLRVDAIRDSLRAAGNPWTHIALVHDGEHLRVYVNGVQSTILFETNPGIWFPSNNLPTVRYGKMEWVGQAWLGQHLSRPDSGFDAAYAYEGFLDDFAWFDYPLSASDVAALMTGFPSSQINEEICDLVDNDCDDDLNEDLIRACSTACGNGVEVCGPSGTWEGCTARGAEGERCDPLDWDCVDGPYNGFPVGEVCTIGTGACETTGGYACNDDGTGVICVGTPGTGDPERCDAIDHDCDGDPLNGFPVGDACVVGVGLCEAPGVYECDPSGDGVVCVGTPATGEPYEICDAIDHDCDGNAYTSADPAGPDFPYGPCTAGIGACERTGEYECTSSSTAECNAVPGTPGPVDICLNGIDDDCDGEVDETSVAVDVQITSVAIGDPSFDFTSAGPCDVIHGATPCAAVTFTVENTSGATLVGATTGVQTFSVNGGGVRQNQSPPTVLPRDVPAGAIDTFVYCWTNVTEREDVSVGVELVGACVGGSDESDDSDYDLGYCGSERCDGFDNDGDGDIDELPEACGGSVTEVCVNDPELGGYYCVEALEGESCDVTGCPVGQTCVDDICVEGCVTDQQCGGTSVCDAGTCVDRASADAADWTVPDEDDGAGAAPTDDDAGRGGCTSAPRTGAGWMALAVIGLALRPRRRQ